MSLQLEKWRDKIMGIIKWFDQLIGTVPQEDFNSLTVPPTYSPTDTKERIITTTRIALSSAEKMFIEHIIFSAPLFTTRSEILEQVVNGIQSISGVKREKGTVKYYIYDSIERRKPENRPYRLIFGQKRYSTAFKRKAYMEARKIGARETQLKFALPSGTLSGWLDQYNFDETMQADPRMIEIVELEEQEEEERYNRSRHVTTEGDSPSSQTPVTLAKDYVKQFGPSVDDVLQQNTTTTLTPKSWRTPELNPVEKEAGEILDALLQMQSNNKKLADNVQLHIKELAKTKKTLIAEFKINEASCEQLISMITATDANIEGAFDTLVKIEKATKNTEQVREGTMTKLDEANAKLRKESGQLKLRQEQVQRDLQEVVRNIPKIR